MIGKIPTWWENSDRGNRKTTGKIPLWWEMSLSGRKKVFCCMDHLVLRHPSYMRGFTYPFSLIAVLYIPVLCSERYTLKDLLWKYAELFKKMHKQNLKTCYFFIFSKTV
jgi:hypothetical protein